MSLIPKAFSQAIMEDMRSRLPRIIARAEAMGDPLGELPELRKLLEDLEPHITGDYTSHES